MVNVLIRKTPCYRRPVLENSARGCGTNERRSLSLEGSLLAFSIERSRGDESSRGNQIFMTRQNPEWPSSSSICLSVCLSDGTSRLQPSNSPAGKDCTANKMRSKKERKEDGRSGLASKGFLILCFLPFPLSSTYMK